MPESEHPYNLRKLIDYIGDNPETIREMVGIFLQSANDLSSQMLDSGMKNDWENVAKAAHKLKPSLDIFGMDELMAPIRQIEQQAKNGGHTDETFNLVKSLVQRLKSIMLFMRSDYQF